MTVARSIIWSPLDSDPRVLEGSEQVYNEPVYPPYTLAFPLLAAAGNVLFGTHTYVDADNVKHSTVARWDGIRLTLLDDLGDTPICSSYDGSVLYGWNSKKTYWNSYTDVIRWTSDGATIIPPAPGDDGATSIFEWDCSYFGETFVGESNRVWSFRSFDLIGHWVDGVGSLLPGSSYDIGALSGDGHRTVDDYVGGVSTVFYWNDLEKRQLSHSPALGSRPRAMGMNDDGSIIYAWNDLTDPPNALWPMYWDNLDSATGGFYGNLHFFPAPNTYTMGDWPLASRIGTVMVVIARVIATGVSVVLRWKTLTDPPTELPIPTGFIVNFGIGYHQANQISEDGSIVAGAIYNPTTGEILNCYWDWDDQIHLLIDPPDLAYYDASHSARVSRDGTMIWANYYPNIVPVLKGWTVTSDIESGVGDIWVNNSFVDFSDPTIRNGFINPNGTWKPLGLAGELPTGASPKDYQTIGYGEGPCYIEYGRGENGAEKDWQLWTVGTFPAMAFDDCPTPDIPPPPVTSLMANDLKITETPPDEPLVFLRYSDDAGASWSNKLAENLGREGEFANNLQWQRLGTGRYRVFELSWSCPALTALTGIFINAIPAGS